MAAGIIKALFGIGKGQMKTIPWTKLTPELHNQLSSQLGKLMFVIKSQNLKLTKFQEDYLRNQLKHMDEFEKRVLTKTETPKPKGEVRPFMGFTPEVIPGGKKLVPSRTGKKKPINVNYTEAEKKLGFPIGEVKYLEDLVDIEKMGMKNYYNLVMDRADEIRKRMRVTDEGGTKIPYREFETLQNELNEIDALMTRVRKEVPADKRSFLKFEDEVTKPDPEDLASGGLARVRMAIGGFTKAEVLIQMLKNTIKGSNDPYVKKTFPNFIKELQKNPELALDPNVWKQFTTGLPKNQRLVVHSDDSVDFFTQSEFGPHNIEKTLEFQNKHNLSRDQANTILRMEPEDRVLEMKRLETIADRSRTKQASGGIAGQLHLNRPGYSKGKVVTGILNFLKSKKGIGKYVPYSKDYRVDMKKLMKGDKPIKLFSGQTKRQSNTMKTFKKDAEFFKTTPEKIAKDRFKDQWFTPYRDYAEGFYDPSDLTATMRTVDLTPKEIAMAKRYVKKMNKLKSISVARMKGLPHAPNINLTLDDNTVIIPRIKLKKLKKDKRLKTDYRIPEKIKKKLGLASGGIAGQLHLNQGGRAKFQDGLSAFEKGQQTIDPDYDIDAMRDPFAFESSIGGGFNYKPNESWEASQARQKQEAMNKRQQINTEFQNYLDQQGYQKYLSDRDVYQSAPNIMGRENKLKAELNRLAAQDKDVAEDFGFANILNDPNYGKEITGYTGPEQMTPVYRNLSPEALQEKLGGSLENIYNQYGIWNNQFRQDPLTSGQYSTLRGQLEDLTKYGDVDPKYSERIDYMMPESFSNLEDIKRRLDPNYGRFDKYNPANKLNYEDIEFKQGYGLSGPSEFYKDILDKTQGLPSKYHGYAKTLMDKLRNPYEPTTQASTPVAEDSSNILDFAVPGHSEAMYEGKDSIVSKAPSIKDYHIAANADLSRRISDRLKNIPGVGGVASLGYDVLAPAASYPVSMGYDLKSAYDRMEPGSGIKGFGKAFMDESPFSAAAYRAAGAAAPLAERMQAAADKGMDARMGRTYAENKQIMADPRMNAPMGAAKGGRIGYAQGTKKPGERYYLPTKGKEWLHSMPEIDPYKKFFRRQNKLMKFKDSKGLAEILGV